MAKSKNYQKLSNLTFEKTVLEEKKSAVLVFGAAWSGNAEIMDSMMERISVEIGENIQFFKVDIDNHRELANFFGINTVPTTIMLKEGEVM